MANKVTKLTVWSADLDDHSGAVEEKMLVLAAAGANLEFILARRKPEHPGQGIIFLSPIKGKKQEEAARRAYFSETHELTVLRGEGTNKAGLGHRIAGAVSELGINLRGLMASVIGKKYVVFLAFDAPLDAERSAKALRRVA